MVQHSVCSACKTVIPAGSTGGLCPSCLLSEAIEIGKTESALADTYRPDSPPPAGESLSMTEAVGDYELLEEIARGGMGVVYRARHRQLNRIVALKMILAGQFASAQDVQRFQREAEATATLDHPGIVPIYEIGQHGTQHFFAMKFIEGGSLAGRFDELRQEPRQIVQLLEKVARAVHHAHQRGILHRDLKPANILLDEEGEPLITDLGLARPIESGSDLTGTGAVVGTPAYMPPEQASGEKAVTTAVDLYSIGAILYEALTGRPPHSGESPVQTLMKVMNEEVTPPREVNVKADRLLSRICMKCLERNSNDRYSSAAALADDLERWLAGQPISLRRPSLTSNVVDMLRANLRSAAGAAVLGIAAGLLLAFCISKCNSKGYVVDNPPLEIYSSLQADTPVGRSMFFMSEDKLGQKSILLAMLGWIGGMMFAGSTIAFIVRPSPGTEAFALGLVAGLTMSITLFTLHIGIGTTGLPHPTEIQTIAALSSAAIGPQELQDQGRQQLLKNYPGLESADEKDRIRLLTFRIFYDRLYRVPSGMLRGIAMSTLLCLFPCLVGTLFATKVLHEPRGVWRRGFSYLEFMWLIVLLIAIVFFQYLLPAAEGETPAAETFVGQILLAVWCVFLVAMSTAIYRRQLKWPWRISSYIGLIAMTLAAVQFG